MNKLLILTSLVVSVASVKAAEAPFQASLTPDIAIQNKTNQINGVALNLWGENPQHALALGFVNGSTGASKGFTLSFFANYADSYTGVAWSLLNISTEKFIGWQGGLLNISDGTFSGLESGWANFSLGKEFKGLQLGLVNYAANLHGVQIGAVNIAMNNKWFKEFPDKLATGFPIVNWSF